MRNNWLYGLRDVLMMFFICSVHQKVFGGMFIVHLRLSTVGLINL